MFEKYLENYYLTIFVKFFEKIVKRNTMHCNTFIFNVILKYINE